MASNELVQMLSRGLLDIVVDQRKKKKPLSTKICLIFARILFEKLSELHPTKQWPIVRRTRETWTPSRTWAAAWLVAKSFKSLSG